MVRILVILIMSIVIDVAYAVAGGSIRQSPESVVEAYMAKIRVANTSGGDLLQYFSRDWNDTRLRQILNANRDKTIADVRRIYFFGRLVKVTRSLEVRDDANEKRVRIHCDSTFGKNGALDIFLVKEHGGYKIDRIHQHEIVVPDDFWD